MNRYKFHEKDKPHNEIQWSVKIERWTRIVLDAFYNIIYHTNVHIYDKIFSSGPW